MLGDVRFRVANVLVCIVVPYAGVANLSERQPKTGGVHAGWMLWMLRMKECKRVPD